VTEGQWDGDKVVLMAFPDRETFTAWVTSPEYGHRIRRSVRCDTQRQQPSMPAPNGGVLRTHWPVACMSLGASFTLDVGCSAR
jgi:Domain of unknown function (DUF1330)